MINKKILQPSHGPTLMLEQTFAWKMVFRKRHFFRNCSGIDAIGGGGGGGSGGCSDGGGGQQWMDAVAAD